MFPPISDWLSPLSLNSRVRRLDIFLRGVQSPRVPPTGVAGEEEHGQVGKTKQIRPQDRAALQEITRHSRLPRVKLQVCLPYLAAAESERMPIPNHELATLLSEISRQRGRSCHVHSHASSICKPMSITFSPYVGISNHKATQVLGLSVYL